MLICKTRPPDPIYDPIYVRLAVAGRLCWLDLSLGVFDFS